MGLKGRGATPPPPPAVLACQAYLEGYEAAAPSNAPESPLLIRELQDDPAAAAAYLAPPGPLTKYLLLDYPHHLGINNIRIV